MKTLKKPLISDDPRWKDYDDLRKGHEDIEATKLKDRILADYIWKKPCILKNVATKAAYETVISVTSGLTSIFIFFWNTVVDLNIRKAGAVRDAKDMKDKIKTDIGNQERFFSARILLQQLGSCHKVR